MGLLQAHALAPCLSPTLHWTDSICMFRLPSLLCFIEFLCKYALIGRWVGRKGWSGTADEVCWWRSQHRMPSSLDTLDWRGHGSKEVALQSHTTMLPASRHYFGLWRTWHCLAWQHLGWLALAQELHDYLIFDHITHKIIRNWMLNTELWRLKGNM